MRPTSAEMAEQWEIPDLQEWLRMPLGGLLDAILGLSMTKRSDRQMFGLAQTISSLWPEYPPVQQAVARRQSGLLTNWTSFLEFLLGHYEVQVLSSLQLSELFWMAESISLGEIRDRMAWNPPVLLRDAPVGKSGFYAARGLLLVLTGHVADLEGRLLSMDELADRMPRGDATFPG